MASKRLQNQAIEFHKLVEDTGMSQRRLASRINVNQREFRRYVAGEKIAPAYVRLALKALILTRVQNDPDFRFTPPTVTSGNITT